MCGNGRCCEIAMRDFWIFESQRRKEEGVYVCLTSPFKFQLFAKLSPSGEAHEVFIVSS